MFSVRTCDGNGIMGAAIEASSYNLEIGLASSSLGSVLQDEDLYSQLELNHQPGD